MVKVHTRPDVALAVLHTQAVEDVGRVETGVVAQLAGHHLQGLGERLHDSLLFVGDVAVRISVHVAGHFHLARATARDNRRVTERALDDHDRVVETALHLGNELAGTTTQDQGARLGRRAFGEDVVALPTDLTLLERAAGAEVAVLDVTACRLGRGAGRLADAVHVVRRDTTRTEDITVGKVPR